MSRRVSEDVGGMYTFTIFMRWLVGRINFVHKPYSFPCAVSNFKDWR